MSSLSHQKAYTSPALCHVARLENDRKFGEWCGRIMSPKLGNIHDHERAAAGEGKAIEGWLVYGAALVLGRESFPTDDRGFGQWLRVSQLETHGRDARAAAMWAARAPLEFADAQTLGEAGEYEARR